MAGHGGGHEAGHGFGHGGDGLSHGAVLFGAGALAGYWLVSSSFHGADNHADFHPGRADWNAHPGANGMSGDAVTVGAPRLHVLRFGTSVSAKESMRTWAVPVRYYDIVSDVVTRLAPQAGLFKLDSHYINGYDAIERNKRAVLGARLDSEDPRVQIPACRGAAYPGAGGSTQTFTVFFYLGKPNGKGGLKTYKTRHVGYGGTRFEFDEDVKCVGRLDIRIISHDLGDLEVLAVGSIIPLKVTAEALGRRAGVSNPGVARTAAAMTALMKALEESLAANSGASVARLKLEEELGRSTVAPLKGDAAATPRAAAPAAGSLPSTGTATGTAPAANPFANSAETVVV